MKKVHEVAFLQLLIIFCVAQLIELVNEILFI